MLFCSLKQISNCGNFRFQIVHLKREIRLYFIEMRRFADSKYNSSSKLPDFFFKNVQVQKMEGLDPVAPSRQF